MILTCYVDRPTRLLLGYALAIMLAALPGKSVAGDIVGQVRDAATHQPLGGVQLTTQGAGPTARAAEDGSYSLNGLHAGDYTLTATVPGYAPARVQAQAPAQGAAHLDIELQAGGVVGEVTVTGKYRERSAPVIALQSSNAVQALTARDLTFTPDENIASSLSRLPGVVALPGGFANTNGVGVDLPGRGEANYVSLRGLDAEFNINTINGVDVAQGEPYSREIQLALLPPTGLQTVVVNKVLTPAQDGDAIGGLIDYRTPNAYDFAGEQAFSMEGGVKASGEAIDYGKRPVGAELALSAVKKFGAADQFGVYASAYYDVRNFSNGIVDGVYPAQINGMYAFTRQEANSSSSPVADLASNLTLTGLDIGYTVGTERRYGGSLSLDLHANDNLSAYMRGTVARQSVNQVSYYSQIYGDNIGSQPVGPSGLNQPLIGNVKPRFYYETNPEEALLSTYQVGLNARFGRLHLAPNLFASYGYNDEPNHFEFSARQPEVAPGYPLGQSALFGGGLTPTLLLPQTELNTVFDIGSYGSRDAGELTTEFASQTKLGAKVDGTYDVDLSWLQTVQFGAKFQSSNRDHTVHDYSTNKLFTTDANDPPFGSLGVFSGSVSAIVPGLFNYRIPLISNSAAFSLFYRNIAQNFGGVLNNASDECSGTIADSLSCDTQHGVEQVSAVYVLANFKHGGLEIIPGLRFEHSDISNTFYVLPENGGGSFQSAHTTYNEPLPSMQVNWRPTPLSVYRGAVWASYVRPSPFQLGGAAETSVSPDGVTSVTQGNPNLKPIEVINYDVSGEWLSRQGGYASAALFYKELHHFIFDSVNAFTNPGTVDGTDGEVISTPLNGGSGHIYGLELAGRQRLLWLPTPFDGFGAGGNVTLEHSAVHTGIAGLEPDERLLNQPDLTANAQLFYGAHNLDVELSYRYVSAYVAQYGTSFSVVSSQLDDWVQENHRVDLHIGYLTPWRVYLDGSIGNLLNSDTYHETVGEHSNAVPSFVYSGRTYNLSARYAF